MASLSGAGEGAAVVVEEIMSWLPPRAVIRFKFVCKRWHDLLSTPFFVAVHTRRNPHRVAGVLCEVSPRSDKMYDVSFPLAGGVSSAFPEPCAIPNYRDNCVLQCCNGLLLGLGFDESARSWRRWVCNPTTRQHRILPDVECCSAVLAFDPSRSVHYRVVLASHNYPEIKVYRSEDNSVETINPVGAPSGKLMGSSLPSCSCFCGGSVYWLDDDDASVMSFSIEQWRFNGEIPRPPLYGSRHFYNIQLYESRGRLRLLRCRLSPETRMLGVLEVLEMARDRSGWVLLHSVRVWDLLAKVHGRELELRPGTPPPPPEMIPGALYVIDDFSWLVVCEDDDDDDGDDRLVMCTMDSKKIVSYNLRRGTFDVLLQQIDYSEEVPTIFACANTLVTP